METLYCISSLMTVLLSMIVKSTSGQAGTLGFFLNGVAYPNGSTVLRTDIGEVDAALQCTTDSTTCCRDGIDGEIRAGEFYFPLANGGGPVQPPITITDGYYRNRSSQFIRLHRQPTGVITGEFLCSIPDASGMDVNLFITIVDISVSITTSGSNTGTAGETYSLMCSVTVTGSTDLPTITWVDPMNSQVPSEMVNTTGDTSTLTFNPLSASHAGTYTCRATLDGATGTATEDITVQGGTLGFFLNGVAYPNGSTVLRTDIGEVNAALQCTTDSTTCCRNGIDGEIRAGEFYFPLANGGGLVQPPITITDGYYRNRSSQFIRLHRQPTGVITGEFRCSIPDASGMNMNLFITLVDITVSITTSGTNTDGETYSLVCSVSVAGSTEQPSITWLDPMNNQVPSEIISSTGGMSTLTYNPLSASHAGTYTCRATLDGATGTATEDITIQEIALATTEATTIVAGPATTTAITEAAPPTTTKATQPTTAPPTTTEAASSTATAETESPGVDGNGMSSLSDTIAYVAGAVAVLIVLIIAVAVSTTIIITCILRNRRAELKLKQKNSRSTYDQSGDAIFSALHPVHATQYNMGGAQELDHEYELIDKYSQPYEFRTREATPPKLEQQKPSSTGEYDFTNFTQCPAYIPVTHGNQVAETAITELPLDSKTATKDSQGNPAEDIGDSIEAGREQTETSGYIEVIQ